MRRGAAMAALFVGLAVTGIARAQVGRVEEWATNVPTGVRSAWLSNGIRVHHKFVGAPNDNVVVTIRMVGGALQEDQTSRGITQAAAEAWAHPQTQDLAHDVFAAHLGAQGINYEGGIIDADLVGMTFSFPPRHLDAALDAATMLIAHPWLDEDTFQAWQADEREQIEARTRESDGMLRDLVADTLFPPGDARVRPLEQSDLDHLELPGVRHWLTMLASQAPMEVGIAGPVSAVMALESAAHSLGTLPPRDRISSDTLAHLRNLGPRPVGPILAERDCPDCATSALMIGFYAPDRRDVVATQRILSAMIFLREQFKSTNWGFTPEPDVGVVMLTGRAFPGYGVFHVLATCAPGDLDEVRRRIHQTLDHFAEVGPSAYEMKQFRIGARADLTDALADPAFWSSRLALLTSIGTDLDQFASLIANYQSIQAEDIRAAFAEFSSPANTFELVVHARKEAGR